MGTFYQKFLMKNVPAPRLQVGTSVDALKVEISVIIGNKSVIMLVSTAMLIQNYNLKGFIFSE
jgi:hypothetical protein